MDAKLKAMYEQLITSVVEGTHKTEAGRELCSALMKAKAQSIVAEMSSLPSDDIDDRDIDLNSKLKRRKSIDPDRDDASCDDIEGDDPALDNFDEPELKPRRR